MVWLRLTSLAPPASTRDRVSLVGPLPGELNRWPTLALLGHPIVDIALDGDEVKVTQAALFEGQVSRVIEIEPPGGRIVWSYEGSPRESFFSRWRGAAQRLPNGNTLITESEKGHVIEVTPQKEIVWELWNPEIVNGARKRIYRLTRLDPLRVSGILPASPDGLRSSDR